jgi:hypothetical protein
VTDGREGVPEAEAGNSNVRQDIWEDKVAQVAAKEVGKIAQRALDGDPVAENILRQRRWYTNMRAVLRHRFGSTGELFADLLGATSARQTVDVNWQQAVEAMDLFLTGTYDAELDVYERYLQYREYDIRRKALGTRLDTLLDPERKTPPPEDMVAALRSEIDEINGTAASYLANNPDIRLDDKGRYDGPLVAKSNGKLYGINSEAVMRALVNVYRMVRQGQTPKTRNFTGNLIGYSDDATIDVWAARYLQRMAGDERIPPAMESGVGGTVGAALTPTGQFGFGQRVFAKTVDRINSGAFASIREYNEKVGDDVFVAAPHELQALLWFAEKEVWAERGWTTKQGEGGSFEDAEAKTQSERFGVIAGDMDMIAAALVDADTPRTGIVTAPTMELVNGTPTETGFLEVLGTADVNPAEVALSVLDRATEIGEPNVTLIRTLGRSELNENARPGAQIAFAQSVELEKGEALLRWLKSQGITNASLISDPRTQYNRQDQSEAGKVFGIRILTTPELDVQYDSALARRLSEEKGAHAYYVQQENRIKTILEKVVDQAAKSDVTVSTTLFEYSDILVVNEKDYGKERARFANILSETSGQRNARDTGETGLVGSWGITRINSLTKGANEWTGSDGQNLRTEAESARLTREIQSNLNGSFDERVAGARSVLQMLGAKVTDVQAAFAKWQLNLPVYMEQYASIWSSIQEADIIPVPTAKANEDPDDLHRRQYDRGLQAITELVGQGITFDPADATPGNVFVQVPYTTTVPSSVLTEYAFVETMRVVADRNAPPASSPVVHIDNTLRHMRGLMAEVGVHLTNKEFARFYQLEMGRSLLAALGQTDAVLSRLGVSGVVRSTARIQEAAQGIWDDLHQTASEDVGVRFSRRTAPARVEWVDDSGRQRRTVRNLTLAEVQSHAAYAAENAERTQVSNTKRTYERLIDEYLVEGDKVLDFGGGLGVGTESLRDSGFTADLYEPFSQEARRVVAPDFIEMDASDVPGMEYDKVLNTFVLNVVPQDIRDNVVERIAAKLRIGGEAIITARPWSSVKDTLKTEGSMDLGNRQVITTRGTYQRGYLNSTELAQEVEDVLGTENFIVQAEPKGPAVRILKVSEPNRGNTDVRYSRPINWSGARAAERQQLMGNGVDNVLRILGGDNTRMPVGDSRYSSFGFQGDVRMAQNQSDEVREAMGLPERHSFEQAREQARVLLQDPAERAKVEKKLLGMDPPTNEVEAYAAQMLVDVEWQEALRSGDKAKIQRVMELSISLRENRADIARALAAGRDMLKTPAERHSDAIKRIIYTYPPFERELLLLKELQRAGRGQSQKAKFHETRLKKAMQRQAERLQKFQKFMKERGYDITNLPESLLEDEGRVVKIIKEMRLNDDTARVPDKLYEWWINSILSAPTTQMANILGNFTNIVVEYGLTRNVNGIINEVRNVFGAELTKDDPRLREVADVFAFYAKRPRMLAAAYVNAWRAANIAFDREMPYVEGKVLGELAESRDKLDMLGARRSITGPKGRIIRIPGRLLILFDELYRSLIIDAEKVAVASRLASLKKLSGEARDQFVEESVFDPSSEAAMVVREQAAETATNLLFQAQVSPIINKLFLETRSLPYVGRMVGFIVPFVTAPTNIIRKALKFLPPVMAGTMLVRTAAHIGGKMGAGAYVYEGSHAAENLAHTLVGSLFMGLGFMMAGVGYDEDDDRLPLITGTATDIGQGEYNKIAKFRFEQRKGIPPTSIRIGDTWIDYSRIEPLGTALAMITDSNLALRNMFQKGRPIDAELGKLTDKTITMVSNQSFLEGVGQTVELMRNGTSVGYWSSNWAASWVPNVYRTAVRSVKPEMIDVRIKGEGFETVESYGRRIGRQALLPVSTGNDIRYDMYGRPLIRDDGAPVTKNRVFDWIWRSVLPIKTYDANRAHPADIMMWNYNAREDLDMESWPTLPGQTMRIEGIDYKIGENIPVYNEFVRRAGKLLDLETRLAIAQGDMNVHNPTETDIKMFESLRTSTRNEARQSMLADGTLNPFDSPDYRRKFAKQEGIPPEALEKAFEDKAIADRETARRRIRR